MGRNGRLSDGGVIEFARFYEDLKKGKLQLTDSNETVKNLNFIFLGDEAIALHDNILKPYAQREWTEGKIIFNIIDCLGQETVLKTLLGLFHQDLGYYKELFILHPGKASYAVLAIYCVLHNFLRKRESSYDTSTNFDKLDGMNILNNGDWRENNNNELPGLQHIRTKNFSDNAKINRDKYTHFYNNKGSVEFQGNMLKAGRA